MAGLCAVLLAIGTAGCAGGEDAYCATLRDEATQLRTAASDRPGADTMGGALAAFQQLQKDAPENVAGSWQTLVTAWQGLDEALDAAGVPAAEYRAGERPDGVGAAEYAAIRAAAEELRSTEVQQAAAGIEQHAREVCGVDLAGSA